MSRSVDLDLLLQINGALIGLDRALGLVGVLQQIIALCFKGPGQKISADKVPSLIPSANWVEDLPCVFYALTLLVVIAQHFTRSREREEQRCPLGDDFRISAVTDDLSQDVIGVLHNRFDLAAGRCSRLAERRCRIDRVSASFIGFVLFSLCRVLFY